MTCLRGYLKWWTLLALRSLHSNWRPTVLLLNYQIKLHSNWSAVSFLLIAPIFSYHPNWMKWNYRSHIFLKSRFGNFTRGNSSTPIGVQLSNPICQIHMNLTNVPVSTAVMLICRYREDSLDLWERVVFYGPNRQYVDWVYTWLFWQRHNIFISYPVDLTGQLIFLSYHFLYMQTALILYIILL